MLGSIGAVASTVIVPMKPEHCARPVGLMLTPAGTGCVENGFPSDHRTGTFADMGAMLKFPMAENCTMPLEDMGSAVMGVNVILCIWRVELIIMELPPQEAINRKAIAATGTKRAFEYLRKNAVRAYRLRIDTSKECRRARDSAANNATPLQGRTLQNGVWLGHAQQNLE
jgi:hypothetical protein